LAIDRVAFSPFWQFDEQGLGEALRATPRTRFRAALAPASHGRRFAGYAICGRSGQRGFVQRLAVHPDFHRRGLGRGLLLDGLNWLRRRGVPRAVVNTQLGNAAALSLYLQTGFRREPSGLSVLSAGLK
jgi:ribosomal protein S18 acetylase RimI-like enzyme